MKVNLKNNNFPFIKSYYYFIYMKELDYYVESEVT